MCWPNLRFFSEFFDWSKITRGENEVLIFSSYRRGKWNYEGITGTVSQAYVSISSKKVKSHTEDFERGTWDILSMSCRSLDSKTHIGRQWIYIVKPSQKS